jgi:hypothetical protein
MLCLLLNFQSQALNWLYPAPSSTSVETIVRGPTLGAFVFVGAMSTAIFIDAGFLLRRFRSVYPTRDARDPVIAARTLHEMALSHLTQRNSADRHDLYRIFVYDCPPLMKRVRLPISKMAKMALDFSQTDIAAFRDKFHAERKCLRKVALRLGRLRDLGGWLTALGRTVEIRVRPYNARAKTGELVTG